MVFNHAFTITSFCTHHQNALNAILTQILQKERFNPGENGKTRQNHFHLAA